MCAIALDLDLEMLRHTTQGNTPDNTYMDIRRYLPQRGFDWMQGSAYFGRDSIDASKCVTVVRRMARKFPWFTPSVRDLRMLRIEENNDLKLALDDSSAD